MKHLATKLIQAAELLAAGEKGEQKALKVLLDYMHEGNLSWKQALVNLTKIADDVKSHGFDWVQEGKDWKLKKVQATKKQAPGKAPGKPAKADPVLDKVYDANRFVEEFANFFTISNLGQEGMVEHWQELVENDEMEKHIMAEVNGWRRVGRAILQTLQKANKPLTLREAEQVWMKDKSLNKLYAKK